MQRKYKLSYIKKLPEGKEQSLQVTIFDSLEETEKDIDSRLEFSVGYHVDGKTADIARTEYLD